MFRGRFTFTILIFFIFSSAATASESNADYLARRSELLQMEDGLRLGAGVKLNEKEIKVNNLFKTLKDKELLNGYINPERNVPGIHFFKGKSQMENDSRVFRLLKNMPKGAALNLHTMASVSSEWIAQNISRTPGLLNCTSKDGTIILTFRKKTNMACTTVSEEREKYGSEYDKLFESLFNLYSPTPEVTYPTKKEIWNRYKTMYYTIFDVINYLPVFRTFHWHMLEQLYDDNVMYAEIRLDFFPLYDENNKIYPANQTIIELKDIEKKMKKIAMKKTNKIMMKKMKKITMKKMKGITMKKMKRIAMKRVKKIAVRRAKQIVTKRKDMKENMRIKRKEKDPNMKILMNII
uniref:Salivary secreted adenosine n=1 Tax=Glossina morsitans morsitans TaxID=37546 RepID=D3TQW6_GLOMM